MSKSPIHWYEQPWLIVGIISFGILAFGSLAGGSIFPESYEVITGDYINNDDYTNDVILYDESLETFSDKEVKSDTEELKAFVKYEYKNIENFFSLEPEEPEIKVFNHTLQQKIDEKNILFKKYRNYIENEQIGIELENVRKLEKLALEYTKKRVYNKYNEKVVKNIKLDLDRE